MLAIRRPQHEARIEIMPLIDVIFLLLTFFIYAMVLMVPAHLLPMEMHPFSSGVPARVPLAVVISVDRNGSLSLNREQIAMETVRPRLAAIKAEDPETVVWVTSEATGTTDRLPVFWDLYAELAHVGLEIKLAGSRPEE